ncbi:MAG: hypothetical protein Q4G05_02930 [Clostridia bacterium]|nr:hypothetical protein [Clostridia bacterium]
MEKHNAVTGVYKSIDPDEVIIFHASSLEDEIRFYLNDTQYFVASETEDACVVKLKEEGEEEEEKKHDSVFSIIKENIRILSTIIVICLLTLTGLSYLEVFIDNVLIYLIIIYLVCFILIIVCATIVEFMSTNFKLKSKHSAEHMAVNFLEINKRLPRDIGEIKKMSRFSADCGCRHYLKDVEVNFISSMLTTLILIVICAMLPNFIPSYIIDIILIITFFILSSLIGKIIKKYELFNFIIKPINKILVNIMQCANTTKKVKDKDIILAYSVAKYWLQIVYPELCNSDDDLFEVEYLNIIINK